jgi:hypothetical protein
MIAVDLLLFLIVPVCEQPINCGIWAMVPIFMFAALVGFAYRRMSKEAQHKMRVVKAMREGHITNMGLYEGKLEDEVKSAEKREKQKQEKKEQIIEEGLKEKKAPEELDHKKIERIVHKVITKKKGKKSK